MGYSHGQNNGYTWCEMADRRWASSASERTNAYISPRPGSRAHRMPARSCAAPQQEALSSIAERPLGTQARRRLCNHRTPALACPCESLRSAMKGAALQQALSTALQHIAEQQPHGCDADNGANAAVCSASA